MYRVTRIVDVHLNLNEWKGRIHRGVARINTVVRVMFFRRIIHTERRQRGIKDSFLDKIDKLTQTKHTALIPIFPYPYPYLLSSIDWLYIQIHEWYTTHWYLFYLCCCCKYNNYINSLNFKRCIIIFLFAVVIGSIF